MKTRIAAVAFAVAFLASAAFAADAGKYKDWPKSPQGYFMTRAERAAWSKLQTEADAEQFIAKFVASRGPGFADDVADRAKAADDHLSVAGTAGSRTLRGKIVILLGPPSSFVIRQRQVKSAAGSSTPSTSSYAAASAGDVRASDIIDASYAADLTAKVVHDYTFTYAKEKIPGNPAKDVVVVVEVNPSTGDDRIVDTRMSRQIDDLLEAAAEARAAAAPKAAP